MVTTVNDVILRLYRTYLYPPDYQPVTAFLLGAIDDTQTTLILSGFAIPEDENLVRVGVIIELDRELMQVKSYDTGTTTLTVDRGIYGTEAVAHADDSFVILSPPYSRQSVYEAIADNIITLYPKLYTVSSDQLVEVTGGISGIGDDLAVQVISVWHGNFTRSANVDATIVEYHPAIGGRALISNVPMGTLWVRYKRRMRNVTADTDELQDLGVDERWVNIIMAGAAADLFAGRDLPQSQVQWVGNVLQTESIEVGTRQDLSIGLVRYRELLISRAAQEMGAEYRPKVRVRSAFETVSRTGLG